MAGKKILVAAVPSGQYIAQKALAGKFDLLFASTLREAQQLLKDSHIAEPEPRSGFDLVICSVHFDDSRMFELLQHIRTVDHYDKLPFLVITTLPAALPLEHTTKNSAEMLGAYGFLELHSLPEDLALRLLDEAVEDGLVFGRSVKSERIDSAKLQKGDPQSI
jgi:hypothetical protein